MSGFTNEVVNAKNVDFSGGSTVSAKLVSNGQMLIGSTVLNAGGTNINVGTMASPSSSLTIGYSSPNITMEVTGAASGKVLQGAGVGVAPTYSTATYPVTAGDSGNVLTSNGTDWSSTALALPSQLQVATLTLTSQQIKALVATPQTFIAAPGVGKVICLASPIWSSKVYGGSNVFVAGSSQVVNLFYGTTIAAVVGGATGIFVNAAIVSTSSVIVNPQPVVITTSPIVLLSTYQNTALVIRNSTATEISGNAANNNTMTFTALYYIATL